MITQSEQTQPGVERTILAILRNLPPERSRQLLTFARFLAFETYQTTELGFLEDEEEYTENDARWDALLSSDAGQAALDRMADEALAAIRAGEGTPLRFTADDELRPE